MAYANFRQGPLWERTKKFAIAVVKLYARLPNTREAQVLGGQVLRSGTSPGAHYREASRARSRAEFISKMTGGLQELEETCYWFELLIEGGIVHPQHLHDLCNEANELSEMFVASINTAKGNR
jgi:four helix bundle protein